MAESNATQVILTDDGLKIIKAQNTADNAASGVTNLNDPNLMSVIEKQNNVVQFAGLTSQYSVLIQNAKDEGINTNSLTTAYNNLNKFMADVLTNPNHASDVDRKTYKNYQDAYNSELAKIQTALKSNTDSKFTSAASATSQAASMANLAKSAADSGYDYANSQIAVNSQAAAKAQSTADNAYSYANSQIAINLQETAKAQSTADNAFSQAQAVGSQASAEIIKNSQAIANAQSAADGAFSQATTAIDNDKVTSQTVTDLKNGSKLTIADLENGLATKVANSDYSSYKLQMAGQIAQKVDNGAFSAYQSTTADLIAQKVATKDFSAYQATTDKAIDSKVESSDFNTYKTQTADLIDDKVSNSAYSSDKQQTASQIAERVANSDFETYKTQTAGLISAKVATSDFSSYKEQTATAINSKVESSAFNSYKTQTDSAITSKVSTTDFEAETKLLSDDINLRVTKDGLIDQINLKAGNTLISSSGQLTLSGKNIYFDSTNPVIIPSANMDSVLVGKKLTAADISANTFSTNNGTFTVESNGAITAKNMTLIGGTLTSPTINASTINGSTINGTTFHGGDIINNANNASQFYPTTISSNGHIYTTGFNSADAMQTDLSTGSLTTKYRATNSSGNQYEAYDTNIDADQITLFAGHTNGKDMSFSQSVTGDNQDGYVLVSPLNGMTLHGDNQQITFNGTSGDPTPKGIIITPYGNINPNGTQNIWYVGNGPTMKTASFGIDGSGTNNIQFNRSLDIGNFNINTYHTITSSDNGPIYFHSGNGKNVDIFVGTVHYDSLVKSSLLSVKKDVKKVDTAYWAQLVNSIDLATYQYKSDNNNSHLRLSSIVDDVNDTKQWQLPDVFIARDEKGKLVGVDDSVLLNATLATVQEQQKQIDQLNGHLLELEAKLNG